MKIKQIIYLVILLSIISCKNEVGADKTNTSITTNNVKLDAAEQEINEASIPIDSTSEIKSDAFKEIKEAAATKEEALPIMEKVDDKIYNIAEEMPRFPGCEDAEKLKRDACAKEKMSVFLYENLNYPSIARENGVEGVVVVSFIVDKNGNIKSPRVLRDIGAQCGKEALRLVKLMSEMPEKWIPGRQLGKPVDVSFMIPIKFRI